MPLKANKYILYFPIGCNSVSTNHLINGCLLESSVSSRKADYKGISLGGSVWVFLHLWPFLVAQTVKRLSTTWET